MLDTNVLIYQTKQRHANVFDCSKQHSLDATLVTNNVREFGRVPGLKVEDWTLP